MDEKYEEYAMRGVVMACQRCGVWGGIRENNKLNPFLVIHKERMNFKSEFSIFSYSKTLILCATNI